MNEEIFKPKKLQELSEKIKIRKEEKLTFFQKIIKAFLSWVLLGFIYEKKKFY